MEKITNFSLHFVSLRSRPASAGKGSYVARFFFLFFFCRGGGGEGGQREADLGCVCRAHPADIKYIEGTK